MNYKPIKSVRYIVVHCADTYARMDIGVEEITQWHRARGFFTIGYHFVIRRDGTLETGRPTDRPGAHARGFNHLSVAVCLVGGKADDGPAENNFTDEQFKMLRALLKDLHVEFPHAQILGHRDLPKVHKECPSFDVRAWLRGDSQGDVDDTPSEERTNEEGDSTASRGASRTSR